MSVAVSRPDGPVYRVGHEPDPWAWTPWEYVPFTGHWDDPEDLYRVVYAASSPLGCFLEVLAPFRPDRELAAELATIEGDAEDDAFPTMPPGHVDRAWLDRRRLGTATLAGDYVDVGHSRTIAELRPRFLGRALDAGLRDFDAAAIRLAAPRSLTQDISRFLYASTLPTNGKPLQGSSSARAMATTNSCGRSLSATLTSDHPGATSSSTPPRRSSWRTIPTCGRRWFSTTSSGREGCRSMTTIRDEGAMKR